jgi:hypothetical protein
VRGIDPVAPSRISDTSASIAMQKVVGSSPITRFMRRTNVFQHFYLTRTLEPAFFPRFLK